MAAPMKGGRSKPTAKSIMAINRAKAKASQGVAVESPLTRGNRPVRPTSASGAQNPSGKTYANMARGDREDGKAAARQKNTMWIMARKDPKTGKTLPGYLAWKTGPNRGKPVSGRVRIDQPGSTYLSETRQVTRGGTTNSSQFSGGEPIQLAKYQGGININSPAGRLRTSTSVADRKTEKKIASRTAKVQARGEKRAFINKNKIAKRNGGF